MSTLQWDPYDVMMLNAHTFLDGDNDNAMSYGRSSYSNAVIAAQRSRSQGPNDTTLEFHVPSLAYFLVAQHAHITQVHTQVPTQPMFTNTSVVHIIIVYLSKYAVHPWCDITQVCALCNSASNIFNTRPAPSTTDALSESSSSASYMWHFVYCCRFRYSVQNPKALWYHFWTECLNFSLEM